MKILKNDRFYSTESKRTFQIVGTWGGNWVLAPIDQYEYECQIYTAEEIQELVNSGELVCDSR